MENENLNNTAELIAKDFELENQEQQWTEEDLLRVLADKIAEMIEYQLEVLLSLM